MWHALFAKKITKIGQIWPWQLLKENTATYMGSPPCTHSQLIPTERRVQQCTKVVKINVDDDNVGGRHAGPWPASSILAICNCSCSATFYRPAAMAANMKEGSKRTPGKTYFLSMPPCPRLYLTIYLIETQPWMLGFTLGLISDVSFLKYKYLSTSTSVLPTLANDGNFGFPWRRL